VKLNGAGYLAIGYADDIAILLSGEHGEALSSLMRSAFRLVENWCCEAGLTVNPHKTGLILFTRKRNVEAPNLPTLFGIEVKLTYEVKYLGVILDSKLNWNRHVEERATKATKVFWQCRRAFGKTWGLRPNVLYWMYRAIVRPILCYDSMLWAPRTEVSSVSKSLTHVQRLGCLCITGAMSSTPTAAMEVVWSLPPVNLFVKQEAYLTVAMLYRGGHWVAEGSSAGHVKL